MAIPAGFLLVDKAAGPSSFETLKLLRKALYATLGADASPAERAAIRDLALGHCGTLDPFATGLLLVAVGRATRLTQYFLGGEKTYTAVLRFGERTKSGDLTDPVLESGGAVPAAGDLERITEALADFTREPYFQTPPMSSAKKVDGKKLYQIERAGGTVEREAISKRISETRVSPYVPPELTFTVTVESGTYIRVLAEDLARKLGTIGHLRELRRTASSRFRVENAVSLETLSIESFQGSAFVPFDDVFAAERSVEISTEVERALRFGQQEVLGALGLDARRDATPLKNADGHLVAIARFSGERQTWRTDVVFPLETEDA